MDVEITYGLDIKDGLVKNQKLDKPIITPEQNVMKINQYQKKKY